MTSPARHYLSLQTTEALWRTYMASRSFLVQDPSARDQLAPIVQHLCRIFYGSDTPPPNTISRSTPVYWNCSRGADLCR